MARIGITRLDVEKAALHLQGAGKAPTVDNIRLLLGTGSRTTISEHLKTWKAAQADGEGKLPNALMALVTGLWERLQTDANVQVNEIRHTAHQEKQAQQQALHQAQCELSDIKKQLHQAQEAHSTAQKINESQRQQIQTLQQDNSKALIREQTLNDQVNTAQAENDRLHHLAQHMQTNLTHYQTAIETLRTEQTLAWDKQQNIWQQETNALKKELTTAETELQFTKLQVAQSVQTLQALQEEHQQLAITHQQQESQQVSQEQQIAMLKEHNLKQELTQDQQQKAFTDITEQLNASKQQAAILADHCQRTEKALALAEDKIETLRHEKLFLVQEKSELTGYLQKMEGKTSLKSA